MIAKALKPKRAERRRFGKLARYILDTSKGEMLVARNVADPSTAVAEMDAVAALSRRTKDPVYHFTISWSPDELVTEGHMQESLDKALAALGLSEHQVLASLHVNTDHPHLHAIVNRVHPETYKAQSMWKDWTRLDSVVEQLAIANGWHVSTPHRTFDPTLGRGAQAGAAWGKPTFASWMNAQLRLAIANLLARKDASWNEFHALVAEYGAIYERSARGGVFVDAGRPETAAGASRVMRLCSLPTLERILGPYQPASVAPKIENAFSRKQFVEPPAALREEYLVEADSLRSSGKTEHAKRVAEIRNEERTLRANARSTFDRQVQFAKHLGPELRTSLVAAARHGRELAYTRIKREGREKRESLARPIVPTFTSWLYTQIRNGDDRAVTFVAQQRQARRVMHLPLPELGHPELHDRVLEAVRPELPEPISVSIPRHDISEP